jgi:hypothetical protein
VQLSSGVQVVASHAGTSVDGRATVVSTRLAGNSNWNQNTFANAELLGSADGPDDLLFQSVKDGKPMRDNNILSRFIKPAAKKLGLGFVNWRCLRTSYGTWLKREGADMRIFRGRCGTRGSLQRWTSTFKTPRVSSAGRREAARADDRSVKYWNVLERDVRKEKVQVVDSMVARDGIEPPIRN